MFERFTAKARLVLVEAQEECGRRGDASISTLHVLHALAAVEAVAQRILHERGVDVDVVRAAFPATGRPRRDDIPPFSPATKKLLETALREALQLGNNYIGTEHLLLAVLRGDPALSAWLEGRGVTRSSVVCELPQRPRQERRLRGRLAGVLRGGADDDDERDAEDTGGLLVALAEKEGSVAREALAALGVEPAALREAVERTAASRTATPDRLVLELGGGLELVVGVGAGADLRARLGPLVARGLVRSTGGARDERYEVPGLADTVLPSVEAWLDALGETEP